LRRGSSSVEFGSRIVRIFRWTRISNDRKTLSEHLYHPLNLVSTRFDADLVDVEKPTQSVERAQSTSFLHSTSIYRPATVHLLGLGCILLPPPRYLQPFPHVASISTRTLAIRRILLRVVRLALMAATKLQLMETDGKEVIDVTMDSACTSSRCCIRSRTQLIASQLLSSRPSYFSDRFVSNSIDLQETCTSSTHCPPLETLSDSNSLPDVVQISLAFSLPSQTNPSVSSSFSF
jgi:hypothetical protein